MNAMNALGDRAQWFYFTNPTNMACHNLTTNTKPPPNYRHLLGLGLTFCTRPKYTLGQHQLTKSLDRFKKDLFTKCYYAGPPRDDDEPDTFDPKLHVCSGWEPPDADIPIELHARLNLFAKERRTPSNLIRSQQNILRYIRQAPNLIVMKTDKNLRPALIERNTYIRRVFKDHLLKRDTYEQLSPKLAKQWMHKAKDAVTRWMRKYQAQIPPNERKYLRKTLDIDEAHLFPHFYATAKVHKHPWAT